MFEKYRPRIIIADDHTLIAEACKQLLETEFEVVAVVNNGQALIDSVCRLNPDVALVDISMPLLNGLDAAVAIPDAESARAAADLAAAGVLAGPCGAAPLAGLRAALSGDGASQRRAELGLVSAATVVLLSTEGSAANPQVP